MNVLINSSMSVTAILFWLGIAGLLFFARRWVGLAITKVLFAIFFIFFTIFLIDNYTTHNLRNFLDIRFYDNTVKDPQGTFNNIKDGLLEKGEDFTKDVKDKGKDLDDKILGSKKESDDSASDSFKDDLDLDEDVSTKNENKEITFYKDFEIPIKDLNKFIKTFEKHISEKDLKKLKSFSALNKEEYLGDYVIVTNTEEDLFKEGKVHIYLYK